MLLFNCFPAVVYSPWNVYTTSKDSLKGRFGGGFCFCFGFLFCFFVLLFRGFGFVVCFFLRKPPL